MIEIPRSTAIRRWMLQAAVVAAAGVALDQFSKPDPPLVGGGDA